MPRGHRTVGAEHTSRPSKRVFDGSDLSFSPCYFLHSLSKSLSVPFKFGMHYSKTLFHEVLKYQLFSLSFECSYGNPRSQECRCSDKEKVCQFCQISEGLGGHCSHILIHACVWGT